MSIGTYWPQPRRMGLIAGIVLPAALWITPEGWCAATTISGIEWYQRHLSGRIPCVQCRHEETCSAFCKRSIEEHGFWLGTYLGIRRLAACR
jgi:hypothetical protein